MSEQINTVLVDDEKSSLIILEKLLAKCCPHINIIATAQSVSEGISVINEHNPDLVFLDIEMPKANGFQLLEHFRDFRFEVIFVTAYDNYAIKAIRFSAADYILKPINLNDLQIAVSKVAERIHQKQENQRMKQLVYNISQPQNPRIGLPTGDRIEFIEVHKIIRCQGEGNYSHIYFEGNKHLLVAKTLVEFEDLLQEYSFFRVHKTHLVNLKQVVAYEKTDGGILQLSNGDKIPISRRRKEDVQKMLKVI